MEEFITIALEVRDRVGRSSLILEGVGYREAKDRILDHLRYVFQGNRFVTVSLETKERNHTISRTFEKVGREDAEDGVVEFLNYLYREEALFEGEKKVVEKADSEASWLSQYDLDSLSQKEKVFALCKHNHPSEWVRSQDIQEEYEILFGEPIKLSSLSTYLSRFYWEGALERKGSRAQWEYRIAATKA
jgi:hypothetical protein